MDNHLVCPQIISWNGLHLAIPITWDTIVRADRHLIFEQDLRPALELRWEIPPAKRDSHNQRAKIISQLQSEANRPLREMETPVSLAGCSAAFAVQCFTYSSSSGSECALLTCKACSRSILLKFYAQFHELPEKDSKIIDSLTCWHGGETDSPWSIHDISFRLPKGFSLHSHSFRFGLSRLSFSSRTAQLTLCRLAPASEHLKQRTFQELFGAFAQSDPEDHEIIDTYTLQYDRIPGMSERLVSRIRRRKPFLTARFNHLVTHDRITGFLLESSQTIQPETVQIIQDSYGIIQEKETGTRLHP